VAWPWRTFDLRWLLTPWQSRTSDGKFADDYLTHVLDAVVRWGDDPAINDETPATSTRGSTLRGVAVAEPHSGEMTRRRSGG
jgi:hypothetical protein